MKLSFKSLLRKIFPMTEGENSISQKGSKGRPLSGQGARGWGRLWKSLGSLKLTVVLMALAILMIFVATLDQARNGLHHAQNAYVSAWVGSPLPIPGGFLIGALAILNMAAAYKKFFKGKKIEVGIFLIHSGILLLVLSAFLAGFARSEAQIWIREGQPSNALETITESELVLSRSLGQGRVHVSAVPFRSLREGHAVAGLPVNVKVLKTIENAQIGPREKNQMMVRDPGALVVGRTGRVLFARGSLERPQGYLQDSDWLIFERPRTFSENEVNAATALVRVEGVGEFVLSNLLAENFMPQSFTQGGITYEISVRLKRRYLPFQLYLKKFTFERYPGTDIPKNFQSDVEVIENGRPVREALIWMNNPLRYQGYTFYQASFDAQTESSTMLMAVRDSTSALPYLAVAFVSLGFLWHFFQKFFSPRR